MYLIFFIVRLEMIYYEHSMPEIEGKTTQTPQTPEKIPQKPWLRLEGVLKLKANTKPNDPKIISLHLSVPGATRFQEGKHRDLTFRSTDPEYDGLKRVIQTNRKPKPVEVRVHQNPEGLSVQVIRGSQDQGITFQTVSERPLGNAFEYFKRISQNKPQGRVKDPLEAGDVPGREIKPFTGNPHFIQGGAPSLNRRRR